MYNFYNSGKELWNRILYNVQTNVICKNMNESHTLLSIKRHTVYTEMTSFRDKTYNTET